MRRKVLAVMAVSLTLVASCGAEPVQSATPAPPIQVQPAPTSTVKPVGRSGDMAVYTSTELGSPESFEELRQAKEIGFDSIIAYGSMNGRTVESIRSYLDAAQALGIRITFSMKDILGETDGDSDNAEHHRALFGATTDAQATNITNTLLGHPAIKSVLISDEQPGGPEDQAIWLPRLKKRYDEIHRVKPVSVVLYWNSGYQEFYSEVKKVVNEDPTDFQIDYYPLPENSRYGPVATIQKIGEMLRKIAGTNGRFVVQAFGWDPVAHPEGAELGFTEKTDAPTANQMVDMAKLAVTGGAGSLAFFALGDPNAASPTVMKAAVHEITQSDWWQQRR